MSALYKAMEDPSLPEAFKQALWNRASSASRREYYYERHIRDPLRRGYARELTLFPTIPARGTRFGRATSGAAPGSEAASIAAHGVPWTPIPGVPENIPSAGSLAGGVAGTMIGGPWLGGVGAEVGGTAGGMMQGKGLGEAAWSAAPASAGWELSALIPWGIRTLGARNIIRAASTKASKKIGDATAGLFDRLFKENPDLQVPRTPEELQQFYGRGRAATARVRAALKLGDLRRVFRNEPAYIRQKVQVPVKTIDPATNMPSYGTTELSLPDALDYQAAMYDRGYLLTGGPRGGMTAQPDRYIAGQVRQQILDTLRKMPRNGPATAARYEAVAHDYGVASVLNDVFTKDAVNPQGIFNHEQVYQNANDTRKVVDHLSSLVGKERTNQWLNAISPQGQRIEAPTKGGPQAGIGIHGSGLPRIYKHFELGGPEVPPELTPARSKILGVVPPLVGQSTQEEFDQGTQ